MMRFIRSGRTQAMANIKLYTKVGCPYCEAQRRELINKGIEFEEIDVRSSTAVLKEAIALSGGRRMVPIIVENGAVTVAPNGG